MRLRMESLAPDVTRRINLVADCVVLIAAAVVCAAATERVGRREAALATAALAVGAWLAGSRLLHQHDVWKGQGRAAVLVLTSLLTVAVTGAIMTLRAALPVYAAATSPSHFFLVLWPGALLLRLVLPGARVSGHHAPEDVLIVGIGPLGRHTARRLRDEGVVHGEFYYLSFPDEVGDGRLAGPRIGTSDDLERVLRERSFHEVYIAGSSLRHGNDMQAAIRTCERFGMPFALPANHFRFDRARPTESRAVFDGYLHYLSMEHKPCQLAIKRALDILVSSAVLLVLSPLLLGVAALVFLTSPGPVFFRQERVGRHGRPFEMLKFRSMIANADHLKSTLMTQNEQSGPVFKIKDDPRVTRVGRFIRRYSIDELPQFINVLRGDMSIVGPRPPLPAEVARYEGWQRRRLSVLPGITCVWQVSGRNEISFDEWMYLDMRYIDHWSLVEDIKLILKTVPVVVTGRGAS